MSISFPAAGLRLGVGVGWNHVEYQALGQDFRTRGARQEEQIELLRRLFTEPVVDFSGPLRPGRPSRTRAEAGAAHPDLARLDRREGVRPGRPPRGRLHLLRRRRRRAHRRRLWNRLRDRVRSLGRSVEDFGGDYVARSEAA